MWDIARAGPEPAVTVIPEAVRGWHSPWHRWCLLCWHDADCCDFLRKGSNYVVKLWCMWPVAMVPLWAWRVSVVSPPGGRMSLPPTYRDTFRSSVCRGTTFSYASPIVASHLSRTHFVTWTISSCAGRQLYQQTFVNRNRWPLTPFKKSLLVRDSWFPINSHF